MVFANMSDKATVCLPIKDGAVKITNEALCALISFHEVFLVSKLGECVNNYTEQDVVKDNLHQEEETHIEKEFNHKLLRLVGVMNLVCIITCTTSK